MKKRVLSIVVSLLIVIGILPFEAVSSSALSDDLTWPCSSAYYVTCLYYYKDGSKHSTRYGYDKGIDIAGGGDILAASGGIVETATNLGNSGFGKYVVIRHPSGYRTLYGHMSSYSVSVGQSVNQGQKIGVMGSTGNSSGTHLHFEYSGGDPWKNAFNSKYASKIIFQENVRSNNNAYNSDKTIVNVIDSCYKKNGEYYYYSGAHTHSYSGSYYEAAHPHKVYQTCSCGGYKYTDEYRTVSSCSQCSFTQESKYNTVKGFKAYPCVTSNFEVKTSDLSTRGGEIYTSDLCTINELYTNGWCKVTFPMDTGGTRTAYTQISKFIKNTSESLTKYTANKYINLYSTSSLSTQIYRVYPGDECYTVGTSGSATQLFMPMSGGGYYVLGWVSTSDLNTTPSVSETLSPGLTNLSDSSYAKCYTISSSRYNVYTSSALTTVGYEGTASSTAWTGENDEIWIVGVGVNGSGTAYAKIKYPVGSSRYTAYVPLHSTLIPGSLNGSYRTAIEKVVGFSDRPGGTTNSSYWVDPGERVYLLSQKDGYSQILYPASGVWRIAWCTNSMYNSMFQAQTYTVSYNANGGSGAPSSQTKTRDVDLKLSSTTPTRQGYTFVGWSTSSTATSAQYNAGSIYSNESSVALYAVWRKQSFAITYDANGGVNAPGVQMQTYGTPMTVTDEQPIKTYTVSFDANGGNVEETSYSFDCIFTGWNTKIDGTGTSINSGSSYQPDSNITLYATYSNPSFERYPIPSKTGYVFDGWFTDADGTNSFERNTVISENITLYARWSQETFSIVYFDDGSSNIPDEQVKTYGQNITLSSEIPFKDGFTFKGWATVEGSNEVEYNPGSEYSTDSWVILYAVWEQNSPDLFSIAIQDMPAKTVYNVGDSLDTTGIRLLLKYSDGTEDFIEEGFVISGFDSSIVGQKTINISYGGKSTSFIITVQNVPETTAKYEISGANGEPGDLVDIYVSIANNPGIISLRFSVSYDTSALELVNVENLALLAGYTNPSTNITSPYVLRWADSMATQNNMSNGSLVKLTFNIKDNAEKADYTVSVTPIEARNDSGTKIPFNAADSVISVKQVEHIPGVWEIIENPTTKHSGCMARKCVHCGIVMEEMEIPPLIDNKVSSITLSSHQEVLSVGQTITLNAIVKPDTATNKKVIWSVYNNDIASVDNGVIKALKPGVTVVIAETEDNSQKDFCIVRVSGITAKSFNTTIDNQNSLIYGIAPQSSNINDCVNVFEGVELNYSTSIIGTGTVVSLVMDNEVIDSYTTVIFGDVNGDSWYDGMDAIIVSCLANGMLSKDDVGDAVYMAADCNHDGVIDSLDVELLQQAGILLANVDQSMSKEELQTDSNYIEYLNLIDQNPTEDEPTTETSFFQWFINFIVKIFNYIKLHFSIIK